MCAVAAWRCILCILCNKTFSSVRCYQQHHKRCHLLEFDHECSACGLTFLSRHSFQAHHCMPHRCRVNIKKREVLAARMREKMQSTPEPYFVFIDSDNQLMPYTGDNVGDVSLKQAFSTDSIRTVEADTSNSVDRLDSEDTGGSGFLQNDPFQLSENSAVLSSLPQCEHELLSSATLETLPPELEMDVCDTLDLQDNGTAVEDSATAMSDEAHRMLADISDEGIPVEKLPVSEDFDEQEQFSTLNDNAERLNKDDDDAGDSGKGQQWPLATLLGNGHLQCNVCSKELRVANYNPHMRRVHKIPSSQSRPITWKVCDRCGYQCQDNYKLRRHVMTHTRYGKFPTHNMVSSQAGSLCWKQY